MPRTQRLRRRPPGYRSKPFLRLLIISGSVAAVDGLVAMVLLFVLLDLGATTALVATLVAAQQAASGAAALVAGVVVDRFGARATAVGGLMLRALLLLATCSWVALGSFDSRAVVVVAVGVAIAGALSGLGLHAQVRTLGDAFLTTATAAWSFVSAGVGTLAPLIAGQAIERYETVALLAVAASVLGAATLAVLALPGGRHSHPRLSTDAVPDVAADGPFDPFSRAPHRLQARQIWPLTIGAPLRSAAVVFVATVVFFAVSAPFDAVYPLYVVDVVGVGPGAFGVLGSLASLGGLVGIAVSPLAVQRFGWRAAFVAAMVGWGATQALVPVAPTLLSLGLLAFLNGATWGVGGPIELERVQRAAPIRSIGRFLGVRAAVLAAAGPLGASTAIVAGRSASPAAILVVSASAAATVGLVVAGLLWWGQLRGAREERVDQYERA